MRCAIILFFIFAKLIGFGGLTTQLISSNSLLSKPAIVCPHANKLSATSFIQACQFLEKASQDIFNVYSWKFFILMAAVSFSYFLSLYHYFTVFSFFKPPMF